MYLVDEAKQAVLLKKLFTEVSIFEHSQNNLSVGLQLKRAYSEKKSCTKFKIFLRPALHISAFKLFLRKEMSQKYQLY